MRKKKFKIIIYNRDKISFYETKVKTWIGWVSFSVFYNTEIIHLLSDPSMRIKQAYQQIYQYCEIKGYKQKDIDIKEINIDKKKKWIFLQRVYSR